MSKLDVKIFSLYQINIGMCLSHNLNKQLADLAPLLKMSRELGSFSPNLRTNQGHLYVYACFPFYNMNFGQINICLIFSFTHSQKFCHILKKNSPKIPRSQKVYLFFLLL